MACQEKFVSPSYRLQISADSCRRSIFKSVDIQITGPHSRFLESRYSRLNVVFEVVHAVIAVNQQKFRALPGLRRNPSYYTGVTVDGRELMTKGATGRNPSWDQNLTL
jgi:hypothetical protein